MGFYLNGYVLKPARSGTGNAKSTGEANSTISREHILPTELTALGYDSSTSGKPVEPYADMYKAAVLDAPSDSTQYGVFAATTSQFSVVEDQIFKVTTSGDNVKPLKGSLVVGVHDDGTISFSITDENSRDLSDIISITLKRGDTLASVSCTSFATENPKKGTVTLNSTEQTALGGGFSIERGDTITSCEYVLAGAKYFWSKNTPRKTRFSWDGKEDSWRPLKGGGAKSLGIIKPDEKYKLFPTLTRFSVGQTLPYPATSDEYAIIRYGISSDANSNPLQVYVISDALADAGIWRSDLGWDAYSSVVGVNNGVLLLNPTFIEAEAGIEIWYNPENFDPNSSGIITQLQNLSTSTNINHPVLSPVPEPDEYPLIRLGYRLHLDAIPVENDAALSNPSSLSEGTVQFSLTTGKTCFSAADINKSKPSSADYKKSFLLSKIYFDGVVLSKIPVPIRQPVPVLNSSGASVDGNPEVVSSGDYYLPVSKPLPPPGVSGVLLSPDGTGYPPTVGTYESRPVGLGLSRKLLLGDTFFFNTGKRFIQTIEKEYDEDLTSFEFKVKSTEVEVSKMTSTSQPTGYNDASKIQLKKRKAKGEPLYFIQSCLTPSRYVSDAKMYSRRYEPYVFEGTESIKVFVDSTSYTINFTAGSYSAEQLSTFINTSSGSSICGHFRGRIFLQTTSPTGSVEIGYNSDLQDLSGHSITGLLPLWRIEAANNSPFKWLPDSGASLELYRSPTNLNGKSGDPDCKEVGTFSDKLLENSIKEFPFQGVEYPPIEDIPGYDEDVHFRVSIGGFPIDMPNYGFNSDVGIKYDFDEDRVIWTELGSTPSTRVLQPDVSLQLANGEILPETLSSQSMGSSFGLYYRNSDGTLIDSSKELIAGTSYLLLDGGSSGLATIINVEGALLSQGGGGVSTITSQFSNPKYTNDSAQNAVLQQELYDTVQIGNLLEVQNTESVGVYTITGKSLTLGVAVFDVTPSFPETFTGGAWKIHSMKTYDQIDDSLIADVKLYQKNHLPSEPFKVRTLSLTGTVPATLTAEVKDAVESSREVSIRVGLPHGSPELTVSYLSTGEKVGIIAETGLKIPDVSNPHFSSSSGTDIYFQIRIGAEKFNSALGNLTLDAGANPSKIDVTTSTGAITIGSSLVSEFSGTDVFFDELFLPRTSLGSGAAEIDAETGQVNVNSTIVDGSKIYFVEQMIGDNFKDVTTSPLNGGVYINKPLRAGQIVETDYFLADTAGDKKLNDSGDPINIVEFLPNIIRLEVCTRIDAKTYSFNPAGRTISQEVEPFIWVGVNLQNYAGITTAIVDFTNNQIKFTSDVSSSETVKINYGVFEATGGEQTFSVSTPPVYRKPFFIEKGENSFVLETDRTSDFPQGHLMVLGGVPLYILTSMYNAIAQQTVVVFTPETVEELGTRSPGVEAPLLVSDLPVLVSSGGNTGFLPLLTTGYQPAPKNAVEVVFFGDASQYMKNNHLLEIGENPYIISSSEVSEDGRFTTVTLSNGLYNSSNGETVRVSVRPLVTNKTIFTAPHIPVVSEDFEVLTVNPNNPGKRLVENLHYTLSETGKISLLSPFQEELQPQERLFMSYTRLVQVSPTVENNALLTPVFSGKYLFTTEPNDENRIKSSKFRGSYKFRNPDSFFFDIVPLSEFIPTVVDELLSGASSSTSGAFVFDGTVDSSAQGEVGLRAEVTEFQNKDRAARTYIEFFNEIIVNFEQILEAIDGRIIGDRDGKFRFFVGHDKKYAPPGWEDPYTGNLNTRLIWREIIEEWAPSAYSTDGGYYIEKDPLYDPTTAEVPDPTNNPGETDGKVPDSENLARYTAKQRSRIKNDMDDRVLVGFKKPKGLAFLFPMFNIEGKFRSMWENSPFSRLFPEQTKHFSRLYPGLEATEGPNGITDGGFYSPGRTLTRPGPEPGEEQEEKVSTKNTAIGVIANPALGEISGIVDVTVQERLARARVWAVYPEGSADLDAALGTSTIGKATLVLTPLPLSSFPVNPQTGFPDVAQLISNSGELFDIVSGDGDLSTPGFVAGDRVNYGVPDGTLYNLSVSDAGVFVKEVYQGCVVTLMDKDGNDIAGNVISATGSENWEDVVSESEGYGDTLFVVPTNNLPEIADSGSPTIEEMGQVIAGIPDYRIQFDLKVGKRTGEFIDTSLPTKEDDFPLDLRGFFGQNPPEPLTPIEGLVEFVNGSENPAQLPCLLGQDKDDSGDHQIPYMKGSNTEVDVLTKIMNNSFSLFKDTTYSPLPSVTGYTIPVSVPWASQTQFWNAPFPNEIRSLGNTRYQLDLSTLQDPDTLYVDQDPVPIDSTGQYQTDSAIGSMRPYDLAFVQTSGPLPAKWQGIREISNARTTNHGPVTRKMIDFPRFVTPTPSSSLHKFVLQNYTTYFSGEGATPTTGMLAEEGSVGPGVNFTRFDPTSVPDFYWGDILNLWDIGNDNALVFKFFDPDPTSSTGVLGSIVFVRGTVGNSFYCTNAVGTIVAGSHHSANLGIDGSNRLVFYTNSAAPAPLTLMSLSNGQKYDFSISLDSYISSATNALTGNSLVTGGGTGSVGLYVWWDRLSIFAPIPFNLAAPAYPPYYSANSNVAVSTSFSLREFKRTATGPWITVNSDSEINGGMPLYFKRRIGPDQWGQVSQGTEYVGTWQQAITRGVLKALSMQANATSPNLGDIEDIKLNLAPTSDLPQNPVANKPIGYGASGICRDDDFTSGGFYHSPVRPYIETPDDVSQVKGGDVVCIVSLGTTRNGSYIVRHAVQHDGVNFGASSQPLRASKGYADAGTNNAFDLRFPKLKSFTSTRIVVENVEPIPNSPTGHGFAAGVGPFYIILKDTYMSYVGGNYVPLAETILTFQSGSVSYDASAKELTFESNYAYRDQAGVGSLTYSEFEAFLKKGQKVSGMKYFRVNRLDSNMPPNNCVGAASAQSGAVGLIGGFSDISIGSTSSWHPSPSFTTFETSASTIENLIPPNTTPSSSGKIGINVPEAAPDYIFQSDRNTVVYGHGYTTPLTQTSNVMGVADYIDLSQLDVVNWRDMHTGGTSAGGWSIVSILPGDRIVAGDNIDLTTTSEGFFALAGIFCEPTSPLPTSLTYGSTQPRVISNSYTGIPQITGMRNSHDFTDPQEYEETVGYVVRRMRRFQEVQSNVSGFAEKLKYLYKMRRGATSFATDQIFEAFVLAPTYPTATTIGNFDDPKVNINPGDMLKLYDATGNLVATSEIQKIVDSRTLKLRQSIIPSVSGGTFEIHLNQPIVPHEQSCDQLLNLVTDKVLFERRVPRVSPSEDGGKVAEFNEFQDTAVTDWGSADIKQGDYLVIDPQGSLYSGTETGVGPKGDVGLNDGGQMKRAVSSTGASSVFTAGPAASLDDNRGFYRVGEIDPLQPNILPVNGACRFAGGSPDGSDNVVFGKVENYILGWDHRYVLLPQISSSGLTGFIGEGQQALRPTALPSGTSYASRTGQDSFKSIEPFSYKIIRPSNVFSQDAVELVLFMRERLLSWMEYIESLEQGNFSGDYYIFQRDDHITNVGNGTDPSSGLGVITNAYLTGLFGYIDASPYTNNESCLSLLGRRFFVQDYKLDKEYPKGVSSPNPTYASFTTGIGEVRPLLVDYIEEVLDLEDNFRGQRYSWISVRANPSDGSIQDAKRAESRLPSKIRKERELAEQLKNAGGSDD